MKTQSYFLQTATLAVYWVEGKGQHTQIPVGATLRLTSTPDEGAPFVDVLWNSQKLKMFTEDFRRRTKPVVS